MADRGAAKIDSNTHLLLDQPLIRLPYELLRKNLRAANSACSKESAAVKNLLKEAATGSLSKSSSPQDIAHSLDTMLERLQGLKQRLVECANVEEEIYRQLNTRAAHLADLSKLQTVDDVKYEPWSRCRLDRLLVDYLLRHSYSNTAISLAEDRDVHDLVDIPTFTSMLRLRNEILKGEISLALDWCSENEKELRKMDSNLEFMLRFQQFIELVRYQEPGKLQEAILHAKKYLIPYREAYPKEVSQAAGLLALPPNSFGDEDDDDEESHSSSPYSDLQNSVRWQMLADLFVKTQYRLLGLPSVALLHTTLSSGLSSLKTPACHSSQRSKQRSVTNNSICPICSTELNELARAVPYAHHSKSHVENDLWMLPNRNVYGEARLEAHANKAGLPGHDIKDLVTGEVFQWAQLERVFIT